MTLPLFTDPVTGERSFTMTAAAMTLAVVLLKTLLTGITIASFGDLGGMDAGLAAALLTPTLGAYVARKYTDANAPVKP